MKICVIGTGYVGLVAGTCFAESGNTVVCVDVDEEKINALRRGEIPIYEPGLEELVRKNTDLERLSFTTGTASAVKASEIIFIAVGTPPDEDGSADLQHVLAAARAIGEAADGPRIVVTKSTVPVGTARKVAAAMAEKTPYPMHVVSNPEFLKEGAAIEDFMKPDRVVIGCDDAETAEVMRALYQPFVRTGNPILMMNVASAELTKYASNAMLATRISFMNQIALLCEAVGADVNEVRKGMGTDSRIGHSFLFAGCGYGGSCFPKDSRAIIKTAEEHGVDFQIMTAVEEVNARMKTLLASKIKRHFGEDLSGRTFAVWGLSFKPKTDDMREAPSVVLIEELLAAGAKIRARDPEAVKEAARILGDRITYHQTPYRTVEGADALLVVTEWNEFRNPDFDRMKETMKSPIIFDGRNIYPPALVAAKGFTYYPIGARPVGPQANA